MRRLFWAMALIWPAAAGAEPLRVVADIPPVHALVARVMSGVGEPALLLPPGSSPHVSALRPSQARALETAGVVFWVGPALTPWLERSLANVAPGARQVALLEAGDIAMLPYRVDAEDQHGDTAPAATGNSRDHDREPGAVDPHVWLDPVNAEAWLAEIAAVLGEADPANAATYASNATLGQAELQALAADLTEDLAALRDVRLIVYHDAFQYFEARFGLTSVGAMTDGESAPSPRDLAELRELAAAPGTCIVMEPEADPGLAGAVAQDGGARVVTVDPQGRGLMPGAGYYQALLRSLAKALGACAGRAG